MNVNLTDTLTLCFKSIPISINNILGDPFIQAQAQDTLQKLDSLITSKHTGPISIITKYPLNDDLLKNLAKYQSIPNLIIFYTLTGLSEGNIEFAKRCNVYRLLASIMPNTVLLYRPIIKDVNDTRKTMETLLNICHQTNTCMVYTGLYVDCHGTKRKELAPATETLLVNLSKTKGVKLFSKSACATSYLIGNYCFAHVNKNPENNHVVDALYGKKYNQHLFSLSIGTLGDINFNRFITGQSPTIDKCLKHHLLSIYTEYPLLCSSSWFSWSQITPCDIGCWYCSTEYVFPECKKLEHIGCNPTLISNAIANNS